MSERIIDGRPALPAPEERLALPAPSGYEAGGDETPPKRAWYSRPRPWIILAILLVLALAAWWLLGRGKGGEEQGGERPPAVVSAARVEKAVWRDELNAVGTVRAIQGVDVTSELAGLVRSIRFTNGGTVRAGEPLVLLDTTTEQAQLRALSAQRDQARLAYRRALRLIERGAVAQAEVEQTQASFENLQAQVEQTRTIIEKKRIEAPFSGRLGIRLVSLGQYIAPGTAIVNLQQVAPVFVNFELPEAALARVRTGQAVSLRVDAYGGRRFAGRINAINPQVGDQTRNVTVQATLPNPGGVLRPGMFADVTVLFPGSREVLVVPASAVTTNAYGDSVFLITRPDPKREAAKRQRAEQAEKEKGGFFSRLFGGGGGESGEAGGAGESGGSGEQQEGGQQEGRGQQPRYVARTAFVESGERRGNLIEIRKGLKAGQPVVTAGQLKLEDDAPLTVAKRTPGQRAPEQPRQP